MADLSNVEKILVEKHGFTDKGDGTVAAPGGALYDSEQGGYYTDTGAAPVKKKKASVDPIANLADVQFLAQNTGVSQSHYDNAYKELGLDPNDRDVYDKAQQILKDAGYNPGTNTTFYGSNVAVDAGAKILQERWASAPTDEELIAAGLDPEIYTVTNNNVANQTYLRKKLAEIGATSALANFSSLDAGNTLEASNKRVAELFASQRPDSYWNKKIAQSGGLSYGDITLDMTEWDLIKKNEPLVSDTYQKESNTARPANTGQFDVAAGVNVPVQAVPQTITQQVTPPSYYNQPVPTATKSITDEQAGTFSKQLQTAGLSAVPATATYKTHYAGTPSLVDPTLYAPVGGGTGVQQVIYENNLGQSMTITEMNGTPTTYVPPGFVRKGTMQEIAQQQQQQQQQSSGMATGGTVRGYASGGDVALIKLAKMNGFKGDDVATARSFMNASEGLRKKVQAMGTLMNRGGLAMAQGGSVPNQAMIGGQPHRLAYVNPQEEAMMKAAGGAGVPSYGGIPAYFTIGNAAAAGAGATVTDPSTGTVYTSDGTTWTTDTGYDVGPGFGADDGQDVGQGFDAGAGEETQEPFTVQQAQRTQNLITQTMQPMQAPVSYIQPTAADFIPVDAGQATPIAPYAEAATVGTVQQANQQDTPTAQTYDFAPAYTQVQAETAGLQAEQGAVSSQAQVAAQQQTTSAVTGMTGATGVSTDVVAPAPRDLQTGELIDPVANAASAAAFTEQVQAATATPSAQATVQGQLEGLMQQFEGGETPAWAAGSMRTAMATLSARGLGASSLAGQAVIQATMEAALPIAQMDAQVTAQFESQNLTNRQQRAMLSAQQRATFLGMEFDQAFQARVQNSARIGDIANMNFSAEQNIALENARAANTMNLNNLSNRQAMVMAEAAALSNLDMANLNNRQQAAVQNAQSFLQMDMTNLSNSQQTAIFKSQQNIQALFTDQAAENAAAQFNATSQNQTDQYFANLRSQTSQFNASQQNAMDQFNVNSVNALREFNSEIQQQRDMFNAQNGLLIAQSNAQWRQTVSTANAAAQNESNMNFAKTINALTATNLDAYWQRERDVMSFAYASGESAADRVATILQTELEAELKAQYQDSAGKGSLFATLLKGGLNYLGLSSDIKSAVVV